MRRFLRNNFLVLILLNSGNVFAYLFQLVLGKTLTPEEYGSFNALNSMGIVIAAPIAVLPLVVSQYTVQLSVGGLGRVKSLLLEVFRVLLIVGAGLLLLGVMSIPWLKSYLHLETTTPILIVLVQLTLSITYPVLFGVLQGLHRFTAFGFGSISFPLGRFIACLFLVLVFKGGVNGALVSSIVGGCAAVGIGLWTVKDILQGPEEVLPDGILRKMVNYSLPVFLTTTMCMILGNLDIVLVRHYCAPEESGLYATAAVLGRIAMFLPGVLILVLFPEAARAQATGEKGNRMLWITLGMTALLGGGFALVCAFWSDLLLSLLFSPKYLAAAPLLQIISSAMALLAMANVIFTYSLARSDYTFLWPLIGGSLLMLGLIFMFHDSAMTIARIVLYSVGIILAGTAVRYLPLFRRPIVSS